MVKIFYYKEILFEVGENAHENTELIKAAYDKYFWLHMDSIPSPHVIIHTEIIDEDVLYFASKLCKERCNKKYKLSNRFYVVVTRVHNLELTDIPGEVEFKKIGKKHLQKHLIIL